MFLPLSGKPLLAIMLAAGLSAVPQAAGAAVLITTANYDSGSRTGTASVNPSILPVLITAGRYNLTGYDTASLAPLSYQTYAYDLTSTLTGGVYTLNTLGSTGLSTVKQGQLNALIANTAGIANTADSSAAVQLAIWEVINETSTSYSLTGGGFSTSGANLSAARVLANTYLSNVSSNIWTTDTSFSLGLLSSSYKQDQIYWTVAAQQPVPEPATWALFIGGFGMIGGAMRWRRARSTVRA